MQEMFTNVYKGSKFKLIGELKTMANKTVDIGLLARDSGDPALQLLLKQRQKGFRNRLRAGERANMPEELSESRCVRRRYGEL